MLVWKRGGGGAHERMGGGGQMNNKTRIAKEAAPEPDAVGGMVAVATQEDSSMSLARMGITIGNPWRVRAGGGGMERELEEIENLVNSQQQHTPTNAKPLIPLERPPSDHWDRPRSLNGRAGPVATIPCRCEPGRPPYSRRMGGGKGGGSSKRCHHGVISAPVETQAADPRQRRAHGKRGCTWPTAGVGWSAPGSR